MINLKSVYLYIIISFCIASKINLKIRGCALLKTTRHFISLESVLQVCHALLLSLSTLSLSLVCEEDGTEVDSDEFLMTLPDNTMLMALEPGQTWRPQAVKNETALYVFM